MKLSNKLITMLNKELFEQREEFDSVPLHLYLNYFEDPNDNEVFCVRMFVEKMIIDDEEKENDQKNNNDN